MTLTRRDLNYISELDLSSKLSSRVAALKWAYDLMVREGGDPGFADLVDDIITEYKHVLRRRAQF